MTSSETSLSRPVPLAWPALWKAARYLVAERLKRLTTGSLTISFPDGGVIRHRGSSPGPNADLFLYRWRALLRLFTAGDTGLACAYRDGDCSSSDIKALIAFGAVNRANFSHALSSSRLVQPCDRLRHRLHANTRRGSRRNIAAHYDLGNEFYTRWLDQGMNYSSALYTEHEKSLEQAQDQKLRRIAELLEVEKGQTVLEIGCGWGALAEHLIRTHDCAVIGLTLSVEQLAYARGRLGDRHDSADFRLQDYRDFTGRYGRIASVEMLEAVGERYWPTYFRKLRDSLADDGVAVLQVITIAEDQFDEYRRRPDFIQRFIFPGGMLPTVEIIKHQAEAAGFVLELHEDFGASYARTLLEWRRRFLHAWAQIEQLDFDDDFKRLWEYYLAYCEVGFETGLISVGLFKLRPVGKSKLTSL
jgi:cyclopropane-fatty-acyl-phospholipid synthase